MTLLREIELFDEFMFIIFSAAKSYGATDEKQREKVYKTYNSPKYPENFKTLLDRVNKRFIMFESTDQNQSYRAAKRTEFINMVDRIYSINQKVYSNKLFKRAIEMYEKEKEKEKNKEKEYQEALNKVETLTTQMNEEIEKVKAEQEKEKQLLKEKFNQDEKQFQQEIVELRTKHNEKMQQVQKDMIQQIQRAQDNASHIVKAAEDRMRATMEAELRAERAARQEAEARALANQGRSGGRGVGGDICNFL